MPAGNGRYRYAVSPHENVRFSEGRMKRLFKDNVIFSDSSENIVVVKTIPGAASTVGAALDASDWTEIIGTVAGDDSIFVLVKPREAAETIVERIRDMIR